MEELETIWQQAYEIYKEYSKYPVRKEANFGVATPDVYYEDEHIKISSMVTLISNMITLIKEAQE
jgi:hypothetical protein